MNIHRLHSSIGHRAALYALAPGRTDRHVLSAGGDGWVVEWNADDPEIGQLVASVETRIFSLCSLPELGLVLAGNMGGGLHWIDRNDPARTRNIQHHSKGLFDIARFGPHIFTAGGDGLLTRWDLAAARSVESIQLSHQALRCVVVSENRHELAVGSSDGSVYLLDAETLELKSVLEKAHQSSVFCAAWQKPHPQPLSKMDRGAASPRPNGAGLLLTGGRDAMLRTWDFPIEAENLKYKIQNPKLELPAHWFTINHLGFSPDGGLLATASRDKTIKIWDATSLELLKVVDTLRHGGHTHSVNRLLWLADGTLVSCGDDRAVMWWVMSGSAAPLPSSRH